eukprot:515630_1
MAHIQKFKLRSAEGRAPIYFNKAEAIAYIVKTGTSDPVRAFSDAYIWSTGLFSGSSKQQTEHEIELFKDSFAHNTAIDDSTVEIMLQIIPKDTLLYYTFEKRWLVWDGKKLQKVTDDNFKDTIKTALKVFFEFNMTLSKRYIDQYGIRDQQYMQNRLKELHSHIRSETNLNRLLQILRRQKHIQILSKEQLNIVTFAIQCENGTFAFVGENAPVQFIPHPTHRFTHAYKVPFVPDAPLTSSMQDLIRALCGFDQDNIVLLIDGLSQTLIFVTSKFGIVLYNPPGNLGKSLLVGSMILIAGEERWGKLEHGDILGGKSHAKGDKAERKLSKSFRWWSGGIFDELDPENGVGQEKTKDMIGCAARPIGYDGAFETMSHAMTIFFACNKFKLWKNKCDGPTCNRYRIIYSPYTTTENPSGPYEMQMDKNFQSKLESRSSLIGLFSLLCNNLNEMSKTDSFEPRCAPKIIEYTKKYLSSVCPDFGSDNGGAVCTTNDEIISISPISLAIKTIESASQIGTQSAIISTSDLYSVFNMLSYQKKTEQLYKQYLKSESVSHSNMTSFGMKLNATFGNKVKAPGGKIRVPLTVAQAVLKDKGVQKKLELVITNCKKNEEVKMDIDNASNVNNGVSFRFVGEYKIFDGDWTMNKKAVAHLLIEVNPDMRPIFDSFNGNTEQIIQYMVDNGQTQALEKYNNSWLEKAEFISS